VAHGVRRQRYGEVRWLERLTGTLQGHRGTLVLQHGGTYADGAAKAGLTIVSGCGTDELKTVSGHGRFLADPGGPVSLELDD